jgi:hypothetical protein
MIYETFILKDLEKYQTLAWDFDDTLIGNSFSRKYLNYIIKHPDQKHIIVTYRSHGWQNEIINDLTNTYGRFGSTVFDRFAEIFGVPDEIYSAYDVERIKANKGLLYDESKIDTYNDWKGVLCQQHNAPLIDDNKNCIPGCEMLNVDFYYCYGLRN